ncbi:hypothetical protein LSA03_03460 [Pediococcus argentinicus]|nr:hypothetical protein LSA03_03460 [Pediococcus argentinicus]
MTKGKETLIEVGNWVWTLFSINVIWFLLNFPVILTVILIFSMPFGLPFVAFTVVLILMITIFTIPSLAGVFSAIGQWKERGSGTYIKYVLRTWIKEVKSIVPNLIEGSIIGLIVIMIKAFEGNIFVSTLVLVWGLLTTLVVIANAYLKGLNKDDDLTQFIIQHGGQLLVSTILFVIMIALNGYLKLAFLILICSISFSALVTVNLLNKKSSYRKL